MRRAPVPPDLTCTVIDTHYVRPQMAAAHLLTVENEALFIDTGTALAVPHLLAALTDHGLSPEQLRYIILTHIHLDHAGGAGSLAHYCSNATVLVHPKGAVHMINPQKLIAASIDIYGADLFTKRYGSITSIPADRVVSAGEGYILDFHGRTLHFLDTPGHARHHLSIWDPVDASIFTGDTLGLAYPELQLAGKPPFLLPTTSPAAFDPDVLENSIKRLASLHPTTFFLSHFGPVKAHPSSIAELIGLLRAHAALGCPPSTPGQVAEQVGLLLLDAYNSYCREHNQTGLDNREFFKLLADDIELNAQGIIAWRARRQ